MAMLFKQTIENRIFAANNEGEGVFELIRGAYMQHRGTSQTPKFRTTQQFNRFVRKMLTPPTQDE